MKIIKGHYYKVVVKSGIEYIFQAINKEDHGWIVDIIRTTDKSFDLSKNAFYVTSSDDTTHYSDDIVELSNSEILAIKL